MSLRAMLWALDQDIKSSSQKFVLLAMANFCGDEGQSFAAVSSICRITSLHEDTVTKAQSELVSAGIIKDSGLRGGTTSRIRIYQFPDECGEIPRKNRVLKHPANTRRIPEEYPNPSPDHTIGTGTLNKEVTPAVAVESPWKQKLKRDGFKMLWLARRKTMFPNEGYVITGPDENRLKSFFQNNQTITSQEVIEIALKAWQFKTAERFSHCRNAGTIAYLLGHLNEIKSELKNENIKPVNPRNAGVAGDSAARSQATAEFVARKQRERAEANCEAM